MPKEGPERLLLPLMIEVHSQEGRVLSTMVMNVACVDLVLKMYMANWVENILKFITSNQLPK